MIHMYGYTSMYTVYTSTCIYMYVYVHVHGQTKILTYKGLQLKSLPQLMHSLPEEGS